MQKLSPCLICLARITNNIAYEMASHWFTPISKSPSWLLYCFPSTMWMKQTGVHVSESSFKCVGLAVTCAGRYVAGTCPSIPSDDGLSALRYLAAKKGLASSILWLPSSSYQQGWSLRSADGQLSARLMSDSANLNQIRQIPMHSLWFASFITAANYSSKSSFRDHISPQAFLLCGTKAISLAAE